MNDIIILQASLERIAISLERIASALSKPVEAPKPPQKALEPEQVKTPEPVAVSTPEPPAQPEELPAVTIDQIRKEVVAVCAMGEDKKSAVREIVTAYGRNVSAIPADKYNEVMDKLTALKEG